MHYFCPVGVSSWCSYQKAKSSENTSYKHNSIVPTSVMDAVKPIFAELPSPKLLKKCLGGKTQNSNESFNSTSFIRGIIPDFRTNSMLLELHLVTGVDDEGRQMRLDMLLLFQRELRCE
ncbi:hypothetical protein TNCV_2833021 [Trichonephila clavipes]|nr:hypothetical protein TNCV_2833021 [Trichonephila clavipes]